MQPPMNTNPVQVVVVAQPFMVDKQLQYKNMKTSLSKQLIGLGITQLIIGILCIIFQGVGVGIYADQFSSRSGYYIYGIDYIGHGFWTGILFVITGPFGISGGIKRSRCQVVAFSVLSILSASLAACLFSIAIPGAIIYAYGNQQCDYVNSGTTSSYMYYYSNSYYYRCYSTGPAQTGLAMEALMAILALTEAIVAIWSAAVCCKIGACCCNCGGSCCCPPAPLQNQFMMAGQPFPGQQQMIFANQQQSGSNQPQVFMPNQPFSPNQQQPMFLVNPQQPIVNVDPRQQMAQYQPQPPNLPPYSQQASTYTSLSSDQRDQGSYTGLYTTGIRDTMVYPEQPRIHRGQERAYDNYDSIENGEK